MIDLAAQFVQFVARTLPPRARERYREEWLADLAGASEAGVSRGSIVAGALATAVTIDRLAPSATGLSLGALFRHRMRLAAGLLLAGAVLLSGWYFYGGFQSVPSSGILQFVGVVVLLLAVALLATGVLAQLGAAVVAARSRRPIVVVLLVLGPVVTAWALFMGAALLLTGVAAPLLLAAGVGVVALTGPGRPVRRRFRVAIVGGFAVAASLACAVGILHVFVWNPLARMPALTLDEIYAGLAAAGEAVAPVPWSVAWIVVTVLAIVALLVFATLPRTARAASARRLVVLGLLLVTGTTVVGFVPSFAMGMGLADTFMTSGGDAAPAGSALAIAGQLALAGAILTALVRPAALPEPAPVSG